jgi:hypothetical protein
LHKHCCCLYCNFLESQKKHREFKVPVHQPLKKYKEPKENEDEPHLIKQENTSPNINRSSQLPDSTKCKEPKENKDEVYLIKQENKNLNTNGSSQSPDRIEEVTSKSLSSKEQMTGNKNIESVQTFFKKNPTVKIRNENGNAIIEKNGNFLTNYLNGRII